MSTLAQLISARDAAVTDYASKVSDLRTAYTTLAALDIALGSPMIAYASQRPGFGDIPDVATFRHAFANPNEGGSLQADINAQVVSILGAFTTS